MNLTATKHAEKIKSISKWFSNAMESLDQFGEYDQLQLLICAHELNVRHPNISQKVEEVVNRTDKGETDYVFQFLEQLILMKYETGEERQKKYFDYWILQEEDSSQSDLTKAYHSGYLLMKENHLSTPEIRQKAINWLKETEFLPSMSLTAWTAVYLENHNEPQAAKSRFDELMGLRLENGSWNNVPLQTLQIAHPLSLTNFGTDQNLEATNEFILSQPWDHYSGDIRYETGLLKWLNENGLIPL